MEKQVVFKTTVVGGFDKNSVMDYIAQANKQVKNNEDILTKKIEDLHSANKELTVKNQEQTQAIEMLRKELSEKNNEVEKNKNIVNELNLTAETLKGEILKLKKLLENNEVNLNEQIKKNKELTSRINDESIKGRKYEESVMQIGTAIVEAQNKADVIILEAKNKIARMSDETDSILKIAADKLDEFKVDVANLKGVVQAQMGALINKVANIDEAIEIVQNKFVNYFLDTKNMVEAATSKYVESNQVKKCNEKKQ